MISASNKVVRITWRQYGIGQTTLKLSLIKTLNFNGYVPAIVHKTGVQATLIPRTFVAKDAAVLTELLTTCLASFGEHCTSVRSPHIVN